MLRATEAFEEDRAMGVMMYGRPDSQHKKIILRVCINNIKREKKNTTGHGLRDVN